jgi:branched-chain amino acid aminotransferase
MNFVSLNGKLLPDNEPVFLAANRSYRYGDGLFETVKVRDGKLVLGAFHFERLFGGLSLLDYNIPAHFTTSQIEVEILSLCQENGCEKSARVRLSVSRGDGGLYDDAGSFHYLVECWPLTNNVDKLNEEGLIIDIFSGARKACDTFSNLKSANFLPYVMAARFAHQQKLDDAIVLNQHGRIADATIANIFIIKNDILVTPPLAEGCVDGVMRRWLKEQGTRFRVQEEPLSIADLGMADELFLTNAMYGIRWVKHFREKTYGNSQTQEIYKAFIQTI